MPTVYHRDDAGAPTYTFSASASTNVVHFEGIRTVLKASLVNGYGAKAAAGWTLVAEDTTYIVLRNGAQTGYVCLSWTATGSGPIAVYLSQTYTGMSGSVMTGDGLKTGIAANNSTPQALQLNSWCYSSAAQTWTLIADSKTFVLNWVWGGVPAVTELNSSSPGTYCGLLYVGEDSLGNFISVGGHLSTSSSPTNYFGNSGGTALKDPRTGLLVGAGSLPQMLVMNGSVTQVRTEVVPLLNTTLARSYWGFAGGVGGYLRGLALPVDCSAMFPSYGGQSLGSVTLTTRNLNTAINLGDGYTYFATAHSYLSAFRLMTNNPEFW
ncbi:hypothetical protein [Pseudomonas citronellolis]|uniref:hypothetical protein n=1 Tax=Pseudomonas citronellolis TaxID=53408 RepID=UPI0023E44B12|nr:hypothetical protein [Pseudomonas citronellolis]MDF3935464.1 hypothetical protein [Pseudomonas citronellolis]